MFKFKDYYNNQVQLSFEDHPFSENPRHVWVICKYKNQWVLTKHSRRGLEFPGGKVEDGEKPIEGAIREVFEETGGLIDEITYLGQYCVTSKEKVIVKNIYFAIVKEFVKQNHYFETLGPKLFVELPKGIKIDGRFSFIMKDDVLTYSLQQLTARGL